MLAPLLLGEWGGLLAVIGNARIAPGGAVVAAASAAPAAEAAADQPLIHRDVRGSRHVHRLGVRWLPLACGDEFVAYHAAKGEGGKSSYQWGSWSCCPAWTSRLLASTGSGAWPSAPAASRGFHWPRFPQRYRRRRPCFHQCHRRGCRCHCRHRCRRCRRHGFPETTTPCSLPPEPRRVTPAVATSPDGSRWRRKRPCESYRRLVAEEVSILNRCWPRHHWWRCWSGFRLRWLRLLLPRQRRSWRPPRWGREERSARH